MGFVRTRDDDEPNIRQREKFIQRAYDFCIGISFGGFVARALQNRGNTHTRHARNNLRVKRTPGETESYESDVDHDERL